MERSNKMRSSSSETSSVNGPSGGSQSRRPFIPAGVVTYAAIVEKSPIPIPEGRKASFTRAQKEGLRYEARVHEYLKRLVESEGEKRYKYLQSPWIMFRSEFDPPRRMRYCQPDALLVPLALHEPKKHTPLIIVEIKLSHTPETWPQVRLLYDPVIKYLYPLFFHTKNITALEICRWYDPHTKFPESIIPRENPLDANGVNFNVHIYKPGTSEKRWGWERSSK